MAKIIWGLHLDDVKWGKFKGSYMFNDIYYLRRTKMIVYQIAMIFCICSESVGTAAFSGYIDQRDGIQTRNGVHTSISDIVGVMSFNIFVGIAVATIFGSGFFFDLFFPQRKESSDVRLAWRICSVLMCIFTFADAIAVTVIVATQRATIDGLTNSEAQVFFDMNGPPTPIYRKNAKCIASTVLLWVGMLGTFASTYIMWKSLAHNEKHGVFADNYGPKDDPRVNPDRYPKFIPSPDPNFTEGTDGSSGSAKPTAARNAPTGGIFDETARTDPERGTGVTTTTTAATPQAPNAAGNTPTGDISGEKAHADPERGTGATTTTTTPQANPTTRSTTFWNRVKSPFQKPAKVEPYPGT
ncbi:hypothetical protein NHQ30_001495 [Ciborinia camelliae]|nr:hypothetical protein NHQ30_001495 [Ciborinia camelliae]